MKLKELITLLAIVFLSSCGGGGSSTPEIGVDDGSSEDESNQIVSNINLTSFQSLFLGDGVNYASSHLASATSMSGDECISRVKQLKGTMSNGSLDVLKITSGENDKSGFCELLDLGDYFIASVEGVFSNTSMCSLVIIKKQSGDVSCLSNTFPSKFKFDTSGYYNNTQITPDKTVVYLRTAESRYDESDTKALADYITKESIYKIDLTSSTPSIANIYSIDSTSFTGVQGFLAVSANDLLVIRMYPSLSSDALDDGFLRVVEWWLVTDISSAEVQVEKVDIKYDFHSNRNNNYTCLINDMDGSVLLGYTDVSGSNHRTNFWKINKPNSGDIQTTPIQLGNSKNCWSTNPTVKNNNILGVWSQWDTGQVSAVSTNFEGVDTVINLYLTGNTSGASNAWTNTIYYSSNYGVYGPTICGEPGSGCSLPSTPIELKKFAINSDGSIGTISNLINVSDGLTIKSVQSPKSGDKIIIKAIVNTSGILRTMLCDLTLSAGSCSTLFEEEYSDTENNREIYPL